MLLDEEGSERLRGYFVLFEDGDVVRRIVNRVCKSFMGAVYETSLNSVHQEMREANKQKNDIRNLISTSKS